MSDNDTDGDATDRTDAFWSKLSTLLETNLSWWHLCHHLLAHLDRSDLFDAIKFVREQTAGFTGKREHGIRDWDTFLSKEQSSPAFRSVLALNSRLYLQDQKMFSGRDMLPDVLIELLERYQFDGLTINNAGFVDNSLRSFDAIRAPLPTLRHLAVISGRHFESLEGIQHCPGLETLRLPSNRSMGGLDKLQNLTSLRSLEMPSVEHLSPADTLLRLPHLETLHADEALLALLHEDSLDTLTELSLMSVTDKDLSLLGQFSANKTLSSLSMYFPFHFSMEQLAQHGLQETLERLSVTPATVTLQGITEFKNLRELSINCKECLYPMPHLESELQLLLQLPALEKLSLSIYGRECPEFSGEWRTREEIHQHLS